MVATDKLRILLAEDHALVREGVRRLINDQPDCEVVAEATDGEEAVRLCGEVRPAIALVDLSLPRLDGVKVIARVSASGAAVRLIALTRHDDPSFVTNAVSAGAAGYVLKQSASTELLSAIRAVAAGRPYIDSSIQTSPAVTTSPPAGTGANTDVLLSDVEERVLRLVAVGYSNREIAAQLSFEVDVVAAHRDTAMRRLGLMTRVDLTRYAAERHWL